MTVTKQVINYIIRKDVSDEKKKEVIKLYEYCVGLHSQCKLIEFLEEQRELFVIQHNKNVKKLLSKIRSKKFKDTK